MYSVPKEYYFRLHHIRPRFKKNLENVLIFMASEISKLYRMNKNDFRKEVNEAILRFPGNTTLADKTVDNWRTEISALFGFIIEDKESGTCKPGRRAFELAEKQDLVEAFKIFLYHFQYPGGHIKPNENAKLILEGVRFKPAQYILKLLNYAETAEGKRVGVSKAEVAHCIFNDLRCIRDNEEVSITWNRIKQNKTDKTEYDWTGDVIRYAGDILDYMITANLLVCHGSLFYINTLEKQAINKFITSDKWFEEYDDMIKNRKVDQAKITQAHYDWFNYVNTEITDKFFETDILVFISEDEKDYENLKKLSLSILEEKLGSWNTTLGTKEIGDWGEALVHGHECERIKIAGREDLVHLIKAIPTQYAVGYDVQSIETNELKRYIEVKTTISNKPIDFNKFRLTPNEWISASTLKDRYFVYRLYLSKENKKLFVMQNPVGLYKEDIIQAVPRDGMDIIFEPRKAGYYEELLSWQT